MNYYHRRRVTMTALATVALAAAALVATSPAPIPFAAPLMFAALYAIHKATETHYYEQRARNRSRREHPTARRAA